MRRAVITGLRTARRSAFRKFSSKSSLFSRTLPEHVLKASFSTSARRYSASSSFMRAVPRTPLAIVGALGAIGAYVTYKGPGLQQRSPADQARSLTTDASPVTTTATTTGPVTHDRKALVVDNDQFFTGQILGDGPLAKDTDDRGRKVLEMLSPDDANARLRKNEQSYLVGRGRGVVRYDVVQLPSNDPIEDDHAEKIVEVPNTVAATDGNAASSDWMFWGVFDGHSGWTTSAKLRQVLISFAARELNATYKAALANTKSPYPDPASIDAALKSAFVKLDNEICLDSVAKITSGSSKISKPHAVELLSPALSGSCALLSFYDSRSRILRTACTGDSRAVLGRRNLKTNKWFATPLSEDQTGSNPNEEARMRNEHPGEDKVIFRGRVLGNLEPTRAFGDAAYKWTREVQEQIQKSFFGRIPNPLLKTPPYVTAEPVVTRTQIEPGKGDFVVLATDGLWEMLTNEEVVGLVGQWVDAQGNNSSPAKSSSTAWLTSWFGSGNVTKGGLPVEKGGNTSRAGTSGSEDTPIRQQQWQLPDNTHGRFVVEDKNAATHLIRNALGGNDRDMVCALLTLPSPYSRRYRDDLTVEVIFFGDGEKDGVVRVNGEASALQGSGEVKAKL